MEIAKSALLANAALGSSLRADFGISMDVSEECQSLLKRLSFPYIDFKQSSARSSAPDYDQLFDELDEIVEREEKEKGKEDGGRNPSGIPERSKMI